jgi:hypothetical protein
VKSPIILVIGLFLRLPAVAQNATKQDDSGKTPATGTFHGKVHSTSGRATIYEYEISKVRISANSGLSRFTANGSTPISALRHWKNCEGLTLQRERTLVTDVNHRSPRKKTIAAILAMLAFERTRATTEWPFARAEPDDQPSGSARSTQNKNFHV